MKVQPRKIQPAKLTGEQIVQKKLNEVNAMLKRVDVEKFLSELSQPKS